MNCSYRTVVDLKKKALKNKGAGRVIYERPGLMPIWVGSRPNVGIWVLNTC